jgi:ribonuclease G
MRHDSGLLELEQELGKTFMFEGGDALPIDTFEVCESGDREEIERRSLPFAVGDEVLLTMDEPHMYNAGDAVARVDSLVITVTGAAPLVGKRKLVRIDSIERSSGQATLLEGVPDSDDADGEDEDGLESGARRRGRRGGRRRSRAGSGTSSGPDSES